MNRRFIALLTLALALAVLFSVPATSLQATPSRQDATPTPAPEEEAAETPTEN